MRVLCRVVAGSHLFGLSRPESDTDYKGVFIPDPREIIWGNYKETRNESTGSDSEKNSSKDIDVEFWSLKKFFQMIYEGNNHALEILFAPDEMIVETSKEWEYIRSIKEELVCSKISKYIEYCQSQAAKYGVKGSRVHAVKAAIDSILNIAERLRALPSTHLESIVPQMQVELEGFEFISFHKEGKNNTVGYVEINNRKFQYSASLRYTLEALIKIYDNYGERAKQAEKNEGIDWKAISHAYRVGMQAYELLETGKITLPMKEPERSYAFALKQNQNNLTITFEEVRPILEELADNLKEAVQKSTLRETVHPKWNEYVFESYLKEIITSNMNGILHFEKRIGI